MCPRKWGKVRALREDSIERRGTGPREAKAMPNEHASRPPMAASRYQREQGAGGSQEGRRGDNVLRLSVGETLLERLENRALGNWQIGVVACIQNGIQGAKDGF